MASRWAVHAVIALLAVVAPGEASAVEPRGTYVYRPAELTAPAELIGPGTILYFNRDAATYTPGDNDARENRSSIPIEATTLDAWSCGDEKWAELMACVRTMYAPFAVVVTDEDPGQAPHIETHVGGVPGAMRTEDSPEGLPCNVEEGCVGGIAPLGCFGGIDNAVTFVFSDAPSYGCNVQRICEAAAQETAHVFGLDHEQHCPDPMTYTQGCGPKAFRDVDATCGELVGEPSRPCLCPGSGSTQNSYRRLFEIFGPNGSQGNEPPSCEITAPASGSTVTAGFGVVVTALDDVSIARVELWIDGAMVSFKSTAPFTFSAPLSLASGPHIVEARAVDGAGLTTASSVSVTIGDARPCSSPDECPSGQTCHQGGCVVVPDEPAETGTPCAEGPDCLSGQCREGPGGLLCTEPCNPDTRPTTCPGGFECLPAGAGGSCWPAAGGALDGSRDFTGGCGFAPTRRTAASGAALAGLVLVAGLVAPLVRRRGRW